MCPQCHVRFFIDPKAHIRQINYFCIAIEQPNIRYITFQLIFVRVLYLTLYMDILVIQEDFYKVFFVIHTVIMSHSEYIMVWSNVKVCFTDEHNVVWYPTGSYESRILYPPVLAFADSPASCHQRTHMTARLYWKFFFNNLKISNDIVIGQFVKKC